MSQETEQHSHIWIIEPPSHGKTYCEGICECGATKKFFTHLTKDNQIRNRTNYPSEMKANINDIFDD